MLFAGLTESDLGVLRRRVIDTAACLGRKGTVYVSDTVLSPALTSTGDDTLSVLP